MAYLKYSVKTRWSAKGEGQWIAYDLGAAQPTVSQVAIAWFKGNRRTAVFTIEVSMNGHDWTEVYSGGSSGKTRDLEPYAFAAVPARYIRLVGFGNDDNRWNSLTEVEIAGTSN